MGHIKGCTSFKEASEKLRTFNQSRISCEEGFSTYKVYLAGKEIKELGYFPLKEARLRFAQWLEVVADFNTYELYNTKHTLISTGVAKKGTYLINKKVEL